MLLVIVTKRRCGECWWFSRQWAQHQNSRGTDGLGQQI